MTTEACTSNPESSCTTLPFLVGLGTMFLSMHVSGVSAVFPLIAKQLDIDVIYGQWLLTTYTLALGACLITFGSLADCIGFKRVYIAGMVLFGVSSMGFALAHSMEAMIFLRGVQGIGAAMVSATSVALIGSHTQRRFLGRAIGWQTGMTYLGLTLGPIAASYVVQRHGWRALFALNLPAAALAILATLGIPTKSRSVDPVGIPAHPSRRLYLRHLFYIGSIACFGLMIALSRGGNRFLALLFAAAFLSIFFRVDSRSTNPLLRLRLFFNMKLTGSTADEAVYYFCLYAINFLMPLYLFRGREFAATKVGMTMACIGIARAVAAPFGGYLSDRLGTWLFTSVGILLLAAALCCMYSFGSDTPTANIAAALTLLGIGAGLFTPSNSKSLLGAAPGDQYGSATGILATARNLGMTLGVAAAALLFSLFGGSLGRSATLAAVRAAFAVIACVAILCLAARIPAIRLDKFWLGLMAQATWKRSY